MFNSKISFLKHNPVEELKETVCDKLCRMPSEASSQEELDAVCENCILERIKSLELKEV